MEKSPEAFRTISEVAEILETPAHVLRFWESRFPQIRPVKRAGGRRYYRPGDVALLSGIKRLLHDEGMTIRGVQKILREQGIRHVASLAPGGLGDGVMSEGETLRLAQAALESAAPLPPEAAQSAQIISLEAAQQRQDSPRPVPVQPDLWAQDPGEAPLPSDGPQDALWPQDPEDVAEEAPFVDLDDDAVQETGTTGAQVAWLTPAEGPGPDAAAAQGDSSSGQGGDSADGDGAGEIAAEDAAATLAALLRRARQADLLHRQDELRRLYTRAVDLRDRLATASRRRVK